MSRRTLLRRCVVAACGIVALLLLTLTAAPAHAQVAGDPAAPDTVPDAPPISLDALPDSLLPDTIPGDTLAADSLAAPALDAATDSILRELRALQGFTVTEYVGDRATYTTDEGILRLEGSAQVTRDGDELTADTIIYRERTELVEAYGRPRVRGEQQELEGDRLFYDLARKRATAFGARTEIQQEATWYVTGDMTAEGTERLFGSHAQFTSCSLTIPHYHFEADQVMVIRNNLIVARPARLYFGDVPVMVLPFVVQNLEQGRRSGFLTPRFGVNDIVRTSQNYNRQISNLGFYWAINEYAGAQLSTTWRSGAYTALFGSLDFNWRRQFLSGNLGLERYWRANGDKEFGLNARTSWRPDERTNLGLSGRFTTSEDFIRDASYDPREVTQDLNSSFSLSRRLDWGQLSLGADSRQSIATGDFSMTLPSASLSIKPITLFRQNPVSGGLIPDITFNPGVISGSRSSTDYQDNGRGRQDRDQVRLRVGPTMTIGNFTFNSSADLNRSELMQALDIDDEGIDIVIPGVNRDEGSLSASASYRQQLIGTTSISPNVSLSQEIVRDSLTDGRYLQAPSRVSFGAGLNTDLYGFFPGVGPFSAIRHKLSPQVSYRYAPPVEQTPLQESVFGPAGGRAQNRISLGLTQTFEAKLRTPRVEEDLAPTDTLPGDTLSQTSNRSAPAEPDKVTILSLNTSAFEYDFVQAREEGTGFVTTTVSNTISSDYLRGLTVQMQHELFDRRNLDPADPGSAGKLGRFSPRLSSLSTSFTLGPQSALFRWLERFGIGGGDDAELGGEADDAGVLPGPVEDDDPVAPGQGTFTGNDLGTGGGPWRAAIGYQFSRPQRYYTASTTPINDEAVQTLDGNISFQLTPNWGVNWNTSYSLTDGEFGSHRLSFQRDLHEWQANFNFYQTPNGNTAFEFFVELRHNQELRFDYAERNLGVDRGF